MTAAETTATATPATAAGDQPKGYGAWLGGTDHKSVGAFCLVLAFLFLLTGVGLAALATILGAVNLLTTALRMRAPGVSLARMPMFTWSIVVSSAVFLLAVPVLIGGLVILYVDHHMGAHVLRPNRGGDPLIWRTLFAFFAYPAMWATVFPALGVVSEVVPVFARSALFNRKTVMFALATAGTLAMMGWGSELAGDPAIP